MITQDKPINIVKCAFTIVGLIIVLGLVWRGLNHFKIRSSLKKNIQSGNVVLVNKIITQNPKLIHSDISTDRDGHLQPLALAAGLGKVAICSNLIKAGADINCVDRFRLTPLHLAVSAEATNVIKLLIISGAAIDLKDQWGRTASDLAKQQKMSDDIIRLLEKTNAFNTGSKSSD